MYQTGQSTPASLSCSTILEDLQRNGFYIGLEQHHGLISSARIGLEDDFRRRLTTWVASRAPQSTSAPESDAQEPRTVEAKVEVFVKKFDFTMRCKDDDRESMLRDMLDLAKMMMISEW